MLELRWTWMYAWAMSGEWACKVAFPVQYKNRMAQTRSWAVPEAKVFPANATSDFEQGALSSMSVFPADFSILCLPSDKLFQSKDVADGHILPPIARFPGKQSSHRTKATSLSTKALRL